MERFHGMFIPEKDYLVDLEGLLKYLQDRIHLGNQCLYCGKIKSNGFAVQTHMRDVGHCKIPYTTEEEQLDIGEFYDFRSTYSDDEENEDEEDGEEARVLGDKTLSSEDGGADDGWETDSSASSLDSADLGSLHEDTELKQRQRLGKHRHHTHDDPRSHRQIDGYHSHAHKQHAHAVFYDEFELHLPSGKSVGHRAFQRYFRQNLHNYPTAEERLQQQQQLLEASQDRSNMDVDGDETSRDNDDGRKRGRELLPRGVAGLVGASDAAKAQVRKEEKRARVMETHRHKKRDLVVSQRLNNHKNYYYRYEGGG